MKALALLVMRGPMQAAAVVAVAGLLSLLLPPLSLISGAALALVTLARGLRPGVRVAFSAAVAVVVLGGLLFQQAADGLMLAIGFLTAVWGPMLVVGQSLRRTVSLRRAFLLAALFGAGLAVGLLVALQDPAGWWLSQIKEWVVHTGHSVISADEQHALELLARWMTGAAAASFTVSIILTLMLARWWQAMLYNPGGFSQEFRELRLGRVLGFVTLALLLAAVTTQGTLAVIAVDLLLLTGTLHLLQGVAIVHSLVGKSQASRGWLFGMYVLLLLLMPQTSVTLAFAGLADNWFDFRAFFGTRENG